MKKPWYKSKTIILNATAAALVAAEAALDVIQPMLPINFYTAVAFLLPILNAWLRVVTTQPLGKS